MESDKQLLTLNSLPLVENEILPIGLAFLAFQLKQPIRVLALLTTRLTALTFML